MVTAGGDVGLVVPHSRTDGLPLAGESPYPESEERVVTASGRVISARTAWRAANSVPRGTRSARRSRVGAFARWCAERGRVPTEPGTVPDYLTHLADLRHPESTLVAYLGTLGAWLALAGHPLDAEDRRLCQGVLNQRAAAEASEGTEAAGALQATPVSLADLALMVGTCDRSTPRGLRDAYALLLDWFMAGRCSEPAGLDRPDVVELEARYTDPATGRPVVRPALQVTIRTDKTNPYGRRSHRVRIVGQDDPALCPVVAHRQWSALLDDVGAGPDGPLLRRVDRWDRVAGAGGHIPAGRHPRDARRLFGIGDRTIRNVIAKRAEAAGLVRPWEPEERVVLSTAAGDAALAALDASDREDFRADLRARRRALRRRRARYTGHSMRRGPIREMQRNGAHRDTIEQHARYRPGSRALARYLDDVPDWTRNPTTTLTRQG
ncbi:hypothetical protein [Kitasatospora sp. NPDC057541]|uniref:hypothetical protein n=1 Tax=unclassified Kitasatospora TaxID=2633591 RepID=UPI00369C3499